ncbi:LapA family protein [Desulfovibrio sp. OttesenSCG-928-C06]|nr:LapA family protein [Desulfovibrio sp. OttesenSCG-928-C06]
MRFIKTFILLVLLVGIVLFFLQNSSELEKDFVFNFKLYVNDLSWTSGPIPAFFVILASFATGCLFTFLLLGLDRFKLARKNSQNRKKMKIMEKELQGFRQLPLAPEPEPAAPAPAKPALPEV